MKSFHPHFTSDPSVLRTRFMSKFEQAYAQLIQEKVATRYIAVMLRSKDMSLGSDIQKCRLQQHTVERMHLLKTLKLLFNKARIPGKLYRGTGLYFAELVYQENRERSLFDFDEKRVETERVQEQLQQSIDAINHSLGGVHVVR